MRTIKIYAKELQAVRMNKSSLLVRYEKEEYLVTRRVFNQIVKSEVITAVIIENQYLGNSYKWLALPSIF